MSIFACTMQMHTIRISFIHIVQPMKKVWMIGCTVWWFSVLWHSTGSAQHTSLVFEWYWQHMQQQQQQHHPIYRLMKNNSIQLNQKQFNCDKTQRTNKYKRGQVYKMVCGAYSYSNIWTLLFFLFLHAAFSCCHTCYDYFPVICLFVHVFMASTRLANRKIIGIVAFFVSSSSIIACKLFPSFPLFAEEFIVGL